MSPPTKPWSGSVQVTFIDFPAAICVSENFVPEPEKYPECLTLFHDLSASVTHKLENLPHQYVQGQGFTLSDGGWWYRFVKPVEAGAGEPTLEYGPWTLLDCQYGYDNMVAQLTLGVKWSGANLEVQHNLQKKRDEAVTNRARETSGTELVGTEIDSTKIGSIGLGTTGPSSAGLGSTGLGSIGLSSIQLSGAELGGTMGDILQQAPLQNQPGLDEASTTPSFAASDISQQNPDTYDDVSTLEDALRVRHSLAIHRFLDSDDVVQEKETTNVDKASGSSVPDTAATEKLSTVYAGPLIVSTHVTGPVPPEDDDKDEAITPKPGYITPVAPTTPKNARRSGFQPDDEPAKGPAGISLPLAFPVNPPAASSQVGFHAEEPALGPGPKLCPPPPRATGSPNDRSRQVPRSSDAVSSLTGQRALYQHGGPAEQLRANALALASSRAARYPQRQQGFAGSIYNSPAARFHQNSQISLHRQLFDPQFTTSGEPRQSHGNFDTRGKGRDSNDMTAEPIRYRKPRSRRRTSGGQQYIPLDPAREENFQNARQRTYNNDRQTQYGSENISQSQIQSRCILGPQFGYNTGYNTGYRSGSGYDDTNQNPFPAPQSDYNTGYNTGYRSGSGYDDTNQNPFPAPQSAYNTGYNTGYRSGSGYDNTNQKPFPAPQSGYTTGYNTGYQGGSGYNDTYQNPFPAPLGLTSESITYPTPGGFAAQQQGVFPTFAPESGVIDPSQLMVPTAPQTLRQTSVLSPFATEFTPLSAGFHHEFVGQIHAQGYEQQPFVNQLPVSLQGQTMPLLAPAQFPAYMMMGFPATPEEAEARRIPFITPYVPRERPPTPIPRMAELSPPRARRAVRSSRQMFGRATTRTLPEIGEFGPAVHWTDPANECAIADDTDDGGGGPDPRLEARRLRKKAKRKEYQRRREGARAEGHEDVSGEGSDAAMFADDEYATMGEDTPMGGDATPAPAPTMTAPTMTTPTMTAPTMTAPTMTAPTMTAQTMTDVATMTDTPTTADAATMTDIPTTTEATTSDVNLAGADFDTLFAAQVERGREDV